MTSRYYSNVVPDGATSLGPVNSAFYEDLTREQLSEYLVSSPDWYSYAQEQGLMKLSADGSVTGPTAGTDTILSTIDIDTSPVAALAVFGVQMNCDVQDASSTQDGYNNAEFRCSYYQPSPPAANTTTAAVGTGTLAFRNRLLEARVSTQGITSGMWKNNSSPTRWFRRPPLIVGPQLFSLVNVSQVSGSLASITYHVGLVVMAKYVTITPNTYVNLVALATGSAILPPSIIG